MSGRLSGKRVLLTGGVANIGLAILNAFVAEGATVSVVDIDSTRGADVEKRFGERVRFIKADISKEDEIEAAISRSVDWMGGLDTLCLNAGIQLSGKLEEFTTSNWDKVFAINVRANFIFARESVKHLRAAKKASIVMMSSLAGKRGAPGLLSYSSSKAAVIGLTTTLALELARDGIRVNAVCPGWIDTPFNQPAIEYLGGRDKQESLVPILIPLGRQASPEEVAPLFVYLASDEASYVTAQAINVDGGIYN
ncbi:MULTISPECIES: SDR family NAD(P)-dependent oxidoreductase [Agrobacterium tumefaciens complex]|jgi:NAD(P)-dependent dehydrogenase (short-subunit alcohol dehydrogenase family)|uniref:SDR family oxidoreductase n=2 Tax=Agrobacterium tumefaciens complex TaxID=1183400 RepID=A0A4D7Z7W0_AGRTU|nr:SDR family NAD(P)-dependent oxidoreductase [Agrobacterium tumefaciens]QCL98090.1 SDR family oxidoreductase [Agrobacterium tumefaciens]